MLTPLATRLLERWVYVLVKTGREFVLPYTEARWQHVAASGEYGADFAPFLERVLATLADERWPPGTYYPGGWYRLLQQRGADLATIEPTQQALRPFYQEELLVDGQGQWWVGRKHVTGRVLAFFLRQLRFDAELQRYSILYPLEGHTETRYLHHETPPLRVTAVQRGPEGPRLLLNDDSQQALMPDTLRLNAAEQLYCAVKAERVPAWFTDAARFTLLDWLEERDGGWVLPLADQAVPLALEAPWPHADPPPGIPPAA